MTLLEKHEAMLEDLMQEYDETPDTDWWKERLKNKISDLKAAIERLQ